MQPSADGLRLDARAERGMPGAIYAATGVFLLPGVLLFLLIQAYASPARAIVVADHGVALMKLSALSGNVTTVLAMAPFEGLAPSRSKGRGWR